MDLLPNTTNPTPTEYDANLVAQSMGNFEGQFNLTKSGFDLILPGHTSPHHMVLRQPTSNCAVGRVRYRPAP